MRIGIDARFLTHPQPGGFKTYTENLVQALAKVDSENEYFLYLDRTPNPLDVIPTQANFQVRVITGSFPMIGFPWREQVQLPRQAARDQIDLFHFPCLTAPLHLDCSLVVTVHDMIWAFPEKFSQSNSLSVKRKLMEWYNRHIPEYASRRASAIITVSNASKESIADYLKVDQKRIAVTYEAANPLFQRVLDEQCVAKVRQKYNLSPNFILAIGSADPRKNIKRLIQAYSQLPKKLQEKHRLAIVWTHSFLADEMSEQIEKLGLTNNVHFLKSVPNEDLILLYNAAALFAFPSLYEGFGLPPLEAMACGVPVIVANNSSIPEIVGDAALLFDAEDVRGMSDSMCRILTDETLSARLSKAGVERAASFSWEKCARETVDVYKDVVKHRVEGLK